MSNFRRAQARNRRRTFLLLASLFVLVAITAGAVGISSGSSSAVVSVIAIVIAVGSVWGSYWSSDKIVLVMTRARVIGPEDAPQLYNIVQEVCLAAGLPLPKIAIVEDMAPNAFATGRDPEHAVIAFTTGILATMNRDELQGVAAHELAHVANRDTLVMSIAATTAGIVALIADMAWRLAFLGGGRGRDRDSSPLLLIGAVVSLVLAPLAALLLRSAVSRSRESLADATAVAFTRNPAGLRQALEKLGADSTVVKARSNAVSHLWIESPIDEQKWGQRLFATHPPIAERIAALAALEARGSSGADRGPAPDSRPAM